MLQRLADHWWILLVRGLLALVLGVLALLFPGAIAVALALLFGAYVLVDGVIAVVASLRMTHADGRWGWLLAEGVLGIAFGAAALAWPAISLLALVFVMGFWALLTGLVSITTAWRMRTLVRGEWFWVASGVLSVIFGIAVFLQPAAGALVLVWLFGIYAILFGIAFIGIALRLRALRTTGA